MSPLSKFLLHWMTRQTPHGGEESVENGEVILVVGKRTPKAPKEEVEEPEPEEEGELEEVEK